MEIKLRPIGIIHSPFKEPKGVPIQSSASKEPGTIEIYKEYMEGLKDLDGFSHIYLIYYFHKAKEYSLLVKPFLDKNYHGVFSTRAPARPNKIGLSIVEIEKIIDNKIFVKNIDILDETPLLDIKPYAPKFDIFEVKKFGWLEKNIKNLSNAKDDKRFSI